MGIKKSNLLNIFVFLLIPVLMVSFAAAGDTDSKPVPVGLSQELFDAQMNNPDWITPKAEELYQIYGKFEAESEVNADGLETGGRLFLVDHDIVTNDSRTGGITENFVLYTGSSADPPPDNNLCNFNYTDIGNASTNIAIPTATTINSISVQAYFTSCGGAGTYTVFLNGVQIGTATYNGHCTCTPPQTEWPLTITITDPTALNNWVFGGNNVLSISTSTYVYHSYVGVAVNYETVLHPVVTPDYIVIDPGGSVTFDASGSFSDVGSIISYDWDFDDGFTATGPVVTHSFTNPNPNGYLVTVTVVDDQGNEAAGISRVVVPWPLTVSVMPSYQQSTSYANAELNQPIMVWGRTWGGASPYTYDLDFGDGSSVQGTVTDPSFIGQEHTYTSSGSKTMTLTVTDNGGHTDTRSAEIKVINGPSFDERVNMAIEKGLIWLYRNQRTLDQDRSYWYSTSSEHGMGATGASAMSFEENGHLATNDYVADIYAETVQKALNFLLTNSGGTVGISTQSSGDPDLDGDGIGAYITHHTYANGFAGMALVLAHRTASDAQNEIIDMGPFSGWSYYELVGDMLDLMSYNMGDDNYRGAYSYGATSSSDNRYDGSAQQWPALFCKAAIDRWQLSPPQWMIDDMVFGFQHLQNANGACGYGNSGHWLTAGKTGGMLVGYSVGDLQPGNDNVDRGIQYLGNTWHNNYEPGWAGLDFYAMYGVKKGLQLQGIETFSTTQCGERDWYLDLAGWLLGDATVVHPSIAPSSRFNYRGFGQHADGHWTTNQGWVTGNDFGTSHAILILTKSVTVARPVAVIDPVDDPGFVPFQLDGSDSYHMDQANHSIVEWLWDFDASDGVDWDFPDASGERPWNTYDFTGEESHTYTVTLRVKDDNDEPLYDTETINITVTIENHAPVAIAIPPGQPAYAAAIGETITLDGSHSYDPDEGDPLYDSIVSYEWDTDGDGAYDDDTGVTAELVFSAEYTGEVGLQVTDEWGATSSNSSYISIYASESDLFVGDFTAFTFDNYATADISVTLTSHHLSSGDFTDIKVYFYDGNPLTTGGNRVGGVYSVDLAAGASVVLVPNLPTAGATELFCYLDATDKVPEWDEVNNVGSAAVISNRSPENLDVAVTGQLDCVVGPTTQLTLTGSATDPDGDDLVYSWLDQNSQVLYTGNPYVADFGGGTHNLTMAVNDGTVEEYMDFDFTVIIDDIPPVPTVPGFMLPQVTGQCSATPPVPTAIDDCMAEPIAGIPFDMVGNILESIEFTEQGTYDITWVYNDLAGNSAIQLQQVIVHDNTPPEPTVPGFMLATITGQCSATPPVPTATDNCMTEPIAGIPFDMMGNELLSIEFTEQGTYDITWVYNDLYGNSAIQLQQVIVNDNTPPEPTVPGFMLATITGQCSATPPVPTATDNCLTEPIAGIPFDMMGNELLSIEFTEQGTYDITWVYNDLSGNSAIQLQQVIVLDNTPPVPDVSDLADIVEECSATLVVPTATDNCSGSIDGIPYDVTDLMGPPTDPMTSLEITEQGTYQIMWVYNDDYTNSSMQFQTVIIDDNTPPAPDAAELAPVIEQCSATLVVPTATDNCGYAVDGLAYLAPPLPGDPPVLLDPPVLEEQGMYFITWVYNDLDGNSSMQFQMVTIADVTAPEIAMNPWDPAELDLHLGIYNEPGAVVTDNCDPDPGLDITDDININVPDEYTVTYTATDHVGLVTVAERTVTVVNSAPEVANPIDEYTISFGDPSVTATFDLNDVFDDPNGPLDDDVLLFTMTNSDDAVAEVTLVDGLLTVTGLDLGTTTISLTATDPWDGVGDHMFVLTVNTTADLADAVVFGLYRSHIKKETEIESGNILVNDLFPVYDGGGHGGDHGGDHGSDHDGGHGGGGFSAWELQLEKEVITPADYLVKANRTIIQRDAAVYGDVYYNFLQNSGDIYGGQFTPLDIPLFSNLPPFKYSVPGTENIRVNKRRTLILDPGSYKKIEVKDNAILILTGGVYNVESVKLSKRAQLEFDDATDLRVRKKFETSKENYVGPSDNAPITAADIIIYVEGPNNNEDDEVGVKIGDKSLIFANFYAPSAKIEIKKKVDATGAFYASRVLVDKESYLILDSYFNLDNHGTAKRTAWTKPEFKWLPGDFALEQNYPNPFNPSTTIKYAIPEPGMVHLRIYNILGQQVATLVNEHQDEGFHQVVFEANHLSSGVYLVLMQSGEFVATRKIVMIK